ncbi:protein kinase wis1 [Verticillium alfalfae VaMs.102]|uniref:mitogen-activated protein kinase kinase n=1 Tax=Verticillium alfalfae (strain VaMs.102 / ATCC MYA-4576 / FGSC 10136) TaxID=526221 RepID=C9S9Z3_VERA1|nr:protein kinase wis1 [Verticillium alfalfae VaMs.102]EEY16206.1 protein kinase wis1 [Verticillium alfalfae VaMs.102]
MADLNTPDSVPATPDGTYDGPDGLDSPASPGSVNSSEASTPLEGPVDSPPDNIRRLPSLRTVSDPPNMTASSTPLGFLGDARRPRPAAASMMGGGVQNDIMARARALHLQRMNKPVTPNAPPSTPASPAGQSPGGMLPGGVPRLPGGIPMMRPTPGPLPHSAPAIPTKASGGRKKPGLTLSAMGGGPPTPAPGAGGAPNGNANANGNGNSFGSKMDDFKKYIDSEKGWITFDGAATITRTGVNFANGQTFRISLDEVEVLDELGKGNYGTVYKVKHTKPRKPRFGAGLSGVKSLDHSVSDPTPLAKSDDTVDPQQTTPTAKEDGTTGVIMAMKEMRLELEEAKFTTILRELVILHKCVSPYIIDFYGAFFQEGAVYLCIEFMDGGSIDKLYTGGVPENVLRKITYSTVQGLKTLKDDHNIIHRDVKPTNILVNTRGQVKVCDFGVSGNLVASMAKTNIGCQSYMAPERYRAVAWLRAQTAATACRATFGAWVSPLSSAPWASIPTHRRCFDNLQPAERDPPDLPESFSSTARDFVKRCLNKVPKDRPTYAMLLQHPWLAPLSKPETIAEEAEEGDEADAIADAVGNMNLTSSTDDEEVADWVKGVLEKKRLGKLGAGSLKPALHAAPLGVSPVGSPLA